MNWLRSYAALVQYGNESGHCNVPQSATYSCTLPGLADDGSDYEFEGMLGSWLSAQRGRKKGSNGLKPLLADREAQLQKLVNQGL